MQIALPPISFRCFRKHVSSKWNSATLGFAINKVILPRWTGTQWLFVHRVI